MHALSARYGAVHLYASDPSWVRDRSLWSVDRLHPAERGHRKAAAGFHRLLADRGPATGRPPGEEPLLPPPGRAASAARLATRGTGRLVRRGDDLLPQLLRLAAGETVHAARGTADALDREAAHALAAALASVGAPEVPRPVP
ncbi:hypothetical protein [uncultured Streptomyces sp.]|uniref:hypothetical protein n=1 Tax=uncultured Streptomyces sp. TaxID=174707 RepID=UPI00341467E7